MEKQRFGELTGILVPGKGNQRCDKTVKISMCIKIAVRSPLGYFPIGGIHGVSLVILCPGSSVSTKSFN